MPTKTPPKPPADVNDSESTPAIPPAESELPHVATLEVADNAPSSVLERRVKLTDTAMVIAPETTYDEAIALYDFTHVVRERSRWWLADIVNWMEDHFPDKYTQAIDLTGLTYSRLTTICSVGRKIEPSRRRKEASFTWHERIAYLPYQTADHLLDRAIKEKWTNEQFEDSVARAKGEPTKAEKRAAKEAKPGSTAAKVAASGKEPQVPEGEKPLIWNGYPLRVMIMPDATRVILQGDEALPADEADKAAHHFKHAHGPALAAWLEEHNFIKGGDEPCANSATTECSTGAVDTKGANTTPSASNGAAPNATESAPTPHPLLQWRTLPVTVHKGAILVGDEPMAEGETAEAVRSLGFPSRVDLVEYLETWGMVYATKSNALERAKAAVECTSDTTTLPSVESLTATAASAALTPETFALLKAAVESQCAATAQAIAERDDARDQLKRYDAHTAAMTPLQRAEEALLAFAAASESVNWEEIGANALLRKKWLERLLFPCDSAIDRIQATPLKGK